MKKIGSPKVNSLVTEHKVLAAEKIKKLLFKIVYYLLALILLFTGITKIIDPLPLINTLRLLPIINENLVLLTATILPILEIGLGLLMLLKIKLKIVLPVVAILFFAFFGFSLYGTIVGLDADCGCFGNAIKSEFGWGMVVRNALLLLITIHITYFTGQTNKNERKI